MVGAIRTDQLHALLHLSPISCRPAQGSSIEAAFRAAVHSCDYRSIGIARSPPLDPPQLNSDASMAALASQESAASR